MINKRYKKAKQTILIEGKFIRYVNKGGWEYVERNNCTGIAIILAVTDDKKILFVEQYRPPVDRKVIEFPAGLANDLKAKKKESITSAAKRELLEETGYTAKKMIKMMEGPGSCGMSSEIITMFRAVGLKKVGQGGGDGNEDIVVHEVPLLEVETWLDTMRRNRHFIEPKVYAGLYFLKRDTETS